MPTITRGQWTNYGLTGADAALWRSANPPVAPYRTMANGEVVPPNTTMRAALRPTTAGGEALWAFAVGGAYDTDRERWVGLQATGHTSMGTPGRTGKSPATRASTLKTSRSRFPTL